MRQHIFLHFLLFLPCAFPLYGMQQSDDVKDTRSEQTDTARDSSDVENSIRASEENYDATVPSSYTMNILDGPHTSYSPNTSISTDLSASLADSVGSIDIHDSAIQNGLDTPPHAPKPLLKHIDLSRSHLLRAIGALGSDDNRGYLARATRALAGASGNLCLDQAGIGHIQERERTERIFKAVALQRNNGNSLTPELSEQYKNRCVAVIDTALFLAKALENISNTKLDDGKRLIQGTELFLTLHKDHTLAACEAKHLEKLLFKAQTKIAIDKNTDGRNE